MALRLRNGVSSADTDYGTVLLDEDSGQYWNLNPSAALALRTLLAGGTCDQAVRELTGQYAVDDATAGRDVRELLSPTPELVVGGAQQQGVQLRDRRVALRGRATEPEQPRL
jgi:hypothetical protein